MFIEIPQSTYSFNPILYSHEISFASGWVFFKSSSTEESMVYYFNLLNIVYKSTIIILMNLRRLTSLLQSPIAIIFYLQ